MQHITFKYFAHRIDDTVFALPRNKDLIKGMLTFTEVFGEYSKIPTLTFNMNVNGIRKKFYWSKHVLLITNDVNKLTVNGNVMHDLYRIFKDGTDHVLTSKYTYVTFFDLRRLDDQYHKDFKYIAIGSSTLNFVSGFASGLIQTFGTDNYDNFFPIAKGSKIYYSNTIFLTPINKLARKNSAYWTKCEICDNYHDKDSECEWCESHPNIKCNVKIELSSISFNDNGFNLARLDELDRLDNKSNTEDPLSHSNFEFPGLSEYPIMYHSPNPVMVSKSMNVGMEKISDKEEASLSLELRCLLIPYPSFQDELDDNKTNPMKELTGSDSIEHQRELYNTSSKPQPYINDNITEQGDWDGNIITSPM